jgi:MFS-type transporter involved in bile tolerance (Atg22 family)
MPAWMDLVGRVVPTVMRGRFFGLSSLAAGVIGFGASFVVADVLARVPAPASYGYCFLAASTFLALSWIALVSVREPAGGPAAPAVPLATYLARMPGLLRRDRNLAWFLGARAFAMAGTMASGFYTVYGLRAWDAPASSAGVFTALLVAGHALGTLILGWVADHAGHRLVLLVGMASTAAANVVALVAPTLPVFETVFVLAGVQTAALNISAMNVLLEFAPVPAERPTYVGLGTTSLAPVAFASPLVAGLLADSLGFRVVFVVALVMGGTGLAMLATRVRDPRGLTATVEEVPA